MIILNLNKLFALLLIVFTLLTGCASKSFEEKYASASIGIIETTGQKNLSYINFYDNDLNHLGELKLKYGSMGSSYDLPNVVNNEMYVVPKGVSSVKDLKIVLKLNLNTGKVETIDMGQPSINSHCVAGNTIYTLNTLNNTTYLSMLNSNPFLKVISDYKSTFLGKVTFDYAKLFTFGFKHNKLGYKSFLNIHSAVDCYIEQTIDLTAHGMDQLDTELVGNTLYFTNPLIYKAGIGEIDHNTITALNLKTNELEDIELTKKSPYQIHNYNNNLFISHFKLTSGEGSTISIYNLQSKEITLHEFSHKASQTELRNDKLYVSDGEKLYMYSISLKDKEIFKLEKSIEIYTKKDANLHYYVSGFFFKD